MRYLQAPAVAVIAATLVMATGCGPQETSGEGEKAAQTQKELDQAKQDIQAAQKELATKTTEIQDLQKQLAAANAKIAEIKSELQDAEKLAAPTVVPKPSAQ
jgi:peptidoglycan hydrolase CwlO-like protein